LSRLFISHSSQDNVAAVAFKQWLAAIGWPNDDVFLDLDSIGAGERWKEALNKANVRCEVVILLASPEALSSPECIAEVRKAEDVGKEVVVVLLRDLQVEDRRLDSFKDRQIVDLAAPPQSHVETFDYRGEHREVRFNATGLARVQDFLEKRGIAPDRFAWPPPNKPDAEPFPGLSAFTEDDAGIFFGRDADIVRGLDRLRILRRNGRPRVLVIQAASGAGKSSYLRAGLWPRLKRDADFAPVAILRPAQGILTGPQGLGGQLAAQLSRPGQPVSPGEIHAQLMAPDAAKAAPNFTRIVAAAAAQALEQRHLGDNEAQPPALIIAVDQAEELFGADDKAESDRFLHLLANLLREPPASVELFCLFTIRSDGAAQLFQTLADLDLEIPETLPLLPLPQTAYRDVILKPLEVLTRGGRRLTLAPALANRLVEDATGADALPLLAFTISHLYREFAATGSLTLEQYDSIGGIAGSIDMALKHALARPGDTPAIPAPREAQFALLRATFIPWLARIDPESGTPMRRVERLDQFPKNAGAMAARLIEARLLVTDRRSGADLIEVAHESLLRQWPALTAWLQADADDLKIVDAVERAADEWARNGRQDGWLDHRAERLASAERVALREDFRRRLGAHGIAYLQASREREQAERAEKDAVLRRELRFQRRATIGSIAAALLMAVVGLFAWTQWQHALVAEKEAVDAGDKIKQTLLLAEQARAKAAEALAAAHRPLIEVARRDSENGDAGTALLLGIEAAAPYIPEAELQLDLTWGALRERRILFGHEGVVNSAAFSSDGTHIVTASDDRTARLWDAETGKQIGAPFVGHKGAVESAAFSPDGKRILTASDDKSVRLWDGETHQQIGTPLLGHEGEVKSAAFSSDGKRIVTASLDGTARLWNAETHQQIGGPLLGHEGEVKSATFSPDGKRIVTGSDDKTVRLWDAETHQQIGTPLLGHEGEVKSAAFSPDGKRIVTASLDGTARLWDAETHQQIGAPLLDHEGNVNSAVFSPDGKLIVTASSDKTVRLWDAATGKQIGVPLRGHESEVNSAALSPDGKHIVTASGSFVLEESDDNTGKDNTARLWDAETVKQISVQLVGDQGPLSSAAFSPDGKRIVTASDDKTARLWDAETGRQIGAPLLGHKGAVESAAFSPDGKRIVTASTDGSARLWDAETHQQIGAPLVGSESYMTSAAFSPDGKRIVTASASPNGEDDTARLWDAQTHQQIGAPLRGHGGYLNSVAFSPDGKRIVTASDDDTVRLWDAATGKQIGAPLLGHENWVKSAAFSPDGKRIVTASLDGTARLWDVETGQQTGALLVGDQSPLSSASFSPDGKRIVTASSDKTVRLWDADTGKQIGAPLVGHEDYVRSAAFSPDGKRIVTASRDKTARIWNIFANAQELVSAAQAVVPRCLTTAQRKPLFLPPEPPEWCIGMEKWPYQTAAWKQWLADKQAGKDPPLPSESLNQRVASNCGYSIDFDRRITACSQIIIGKAKSTQSRAVIYDNRGTAYINKHDYDNAIADFNEAIKLDPKYAQAYQNRGDAFAAKNDYTRAIADYTEAIALDPKNFDAYKGRGNAYFNKGDSDRAIVDYTQAIQLLDLEQIIRGCGDRAQGFERALCRPSANTYTGRGDAYFNKGDNEHAIADYTQAIQIDPKYKNPFIGRGRAYEAKKDYEDAIADYSELIELDPNNADVYNARCRARALAGRDLQAAIDDCNVSLALGPDDGHTLNSRGLVQLKLGAYDRAFSDYSAAIAKNDKDADSLYGRGVAKLKSGDADGGNADFAAAKAIRPDIAEVYAGYGVIAALAGPQNPLRLDLVTDCDRLAGHPLDNQGYKATTGVLNFSSIEAVPALRACNEAMHQYPDVARFVFEAGRVALAQKDYSTARGLFEKAAGMGSKIAMNGLGVLYANGWGVAQDYTQARQWYENAAAADDPSAMYNLGGLYANGRGVAQDYIQARQWFEKAAAAGEAHAMNSLGVLYENGQGVAKDYSQARQWFEKAAAAGDTLAQENLEKLRNKM
jgi:WD40 repeat protein/tetratricopeptide (TPR) repeat protein